MICPGCKGRRLVETGDYQNDGHGRMEWVYGGRRPCEECGGTGVLDPGDDQARWVGIA